MLRHIWRGPVALLAVLILVTMPVAAVSAQTSKNCRVVIQPRDTIFGLARRFNTTTFQIVKLNQLSNPNLIRAGKELLVPIGFDAEDECPPAAVVVDIAPLAPAALSPVPVASTTSSGSTSAGSFTVELGNPLYSGDGTWVEIPVTVHNHSVAPAIAGGKYNTTRKPDGNYEDVTLVKAFHGDFETPLVGTALLWQANVHMSDGTTHLATVGCRFIEHVHAEGDEPLERDALGNWLRSFHYEINLYDGWFDCGNTYRVNPEDIAPGLSGSSLLNIYLVNPHWMALNGERIGDPYPRRHVTQLDFTLFTPDGSVAGTQSVAVPAPQTAGR